MLPLSIKTSLHLGGVALQLPASLRAAHNEHGSGCCWDEMWDQSHQGSTSSLAWLLSLALATIGAHHAPESAWWESLRLV